MIDGSNSASSCSSKYDAKVAALGPCEKYSTQPDESTTKDSETFGVITVLVPPNHALGHSAKRFKRTRPNEANIASDYIDLKILARRQPQFVANTLGNHDLKLRGHFHGLHRSNFRESIGYRHTMMISTVR